MPRLSLYKPERGQDYKFLDRQISEMFTVGGTDVHIYKYIGTDDGTTVKDHTQIQDMLFLENRDRKYDKDIYRVRGIYNVQDIDFDLSQFGLFLSNDTLFMTIHIKDSVETLGRKIMPGDVFELPHLVDEYAENNFSLALKRFYVVEDINRAAEGFSQTWWPHLYRVKLKQIYDGQEFKDILDLPADEEALKGTWNADSTYFPGDIVIAPNGEKYQVISEISGVEPPNATYYKLADTLRDLLSTYEKEMQISQAVITEATTNTQKSGYDISNYFSLQIDNEGVVEINTATKDDIGLSTPMLPAKLGYAGYIFADSLAPNGAPFSFGVAFPENAENLDYFLRTDFLPNRLFQFKNNKWIKVHDVRRAVLYGADEANNLKGTFINNNNSSVIGGETVTERQALSQALKPKADN